jgi:hypothetical protein
MNKQQIRLESIALALRSVTPNTQLDQVLVIAEEVYKFVTKDEEKDQPIK